MDVEHFAAKHLVLSHSTAKCNVKTRHSEQKPLVREWYTLKKCVLVCPSVSSHLPSSVIEVWYPCGRVSCKSTVGLSMFSLASMPDIPPPSGTGFLKMCRGAGWGACGGGGARAFILLLRWQRHTKGNIICSFPHFTRFFQDFRAVCSESNRHSFHMLYLSITLQFMNQSRIHNVQINSSKHCISSSAKHLMRYNVFTWWLEIFNSLTNVIMQISWFLYTVRQPN